MANRSQINVDGIALDNGDWRQILGDLIVGEGADGLRFVGATFIVMGSTPEELNTRWATTKTDFEKMDIRVQAWGDDSATTPSEDIAPFDGKHERTRTRVHWDATKQQTGHRYICTFAATTFRLGQGGSGLASPQFTGQVGTIELLRSYNAGRIAARTLRCRFTTSYTATAAGPFTISSVASASGKARFTLVGTMPTFVAGQRMTVSGSTAYNGVHEVLAISGQLVTTNTAYNATDTGSALIGDPTTGEANYEAARDTLLNDWLKVEDSGAYLADEGLALTGESIRSLDKGGYTVEVTLNAERVQVNPASYNANVRKFTCLVNRRDPPAWQNAGGEKPTLYTAQGSFTIDSELLGSNNLLTVYKSMDRAVKDEIQRQTGVAPRVLDLERDLDPNTMTVGFTFVCVSAQVDAIKFKRSESWKFDQKYQAWRKGKYHQVQTEDGDPDCLVTVTVERTGFSEVDLSQLISPPQQGGFVFLPISWGVSKDDPSETPAGELLYDQGFARVYRRFKFEGASAPQSIGPTIV